MRGLLLRSQRLRQRGLEGDGSEPKQRARNADWAAAGSLDTALSFLVFSNPIGLTHPSDSVSAALVCTDDGADSAWQPGPSRLKAA